MTIESNLSEPSKLQQGLMDQAIAFFTAGSRCDASINITPLISNHPVAPAVVLFAFTIELYLKLLHAITSSAPIKKHDLHDLFVALPNEIKDLMNSSYGNTDIEEDILKVKSVFVDWRYKHETSTLLTIEPRMLVRVATSAHKVSKELMPGLKVHGENYHLGGRL